MDGPMTQLEERLTAALAARAAQVDESDLEDARLPDPSRRSRGLVLLAAAACTGLVIGVPYAVAQLDGSSEPSPPPATAPPSPTASSSGAGEGADWPILSVGRIDLDGDGTDETVRLKVQPADGFNPMGELAARVEVALPSGTVYTVLRQGSDYHLEGAVDLPGSAGEEQLVGVGRSLRVLDLDHGQLQVLAAPADPPLMRRTDNQGRMVTWTANEHGLSTVRSVEPLAAGAPLYAVERWTWSVKDGELVPVAGEGGCATPTAPGDLVSCFPAAPTRFEETVLTEVQGGKSVQLDFPISGAPAVAHLEFKFAGDYVQEGEAELVVTAGPKTWRAELPKGPAPYLVAGNVRTTGVGLPGVLVRYHGMNDEGWHVFGWVDGELTALQVPPDGYFPGFSREIRGDAFRQTITWIQDSRMYSAVESDAGGSFSAYRWDQSGSALLPVALPGTFCFPDWGFTPGTGWRAGNGRAC